MGGCNAPLSGFDRLGTFSWWPFSPKISSAPTDPPPRPFGRACGTSAHDLEITIAPSTDRFGLGNIVANHVDLCCRFCVEQTSSRDMI